MCLCAQGGQRKAASPQLAFAAMRSCCAHSCPQGASIAGRRSSYCTASRAQPRLRVLQHASPHSRQRRCACRAEQQGPQQDEQQADTYGDDGRASVPCQDPFIISTFFSK